MEEPVNVFFSYSHQDEKLRNKLEVHLSTLQRQKVIKSWHDRKIGAGIEWAQAIDDNLNAADIILLLISADFLASEYCYGLEMERAIARHDAGEARVIPIILRPTDLHGTPFGKLQAFPRDAKPVTRWSNRDEAFVNIAQGIRQAAHEMSQVLRDRRAVEPVPTVVEHDSKRSEDGELSPKTESVAGSPVGDRGAIAPNSSTHGGSFLEEEERRSFVVELGNGVLLEMVAIPGGTFWMGSADDEGGDDEHPRHQVTVAPFWMGKFVVTQAQYETVMGKNPSHFQGGDRPVEQVSWHDAKEFCDRLSQRTGKTIRLPSEAEWEYVCRAGSTGAYCFGDDRKQLKNYAWFGDNSGDLAIDSLQIWQTDQNNYWARILANNCRTHPVGEKTPNAWGLYDLHGNVWEWCLDEWHEDYSSKPDSLKRNGNEAWGDINENDNRYHLLRGGSWSHDAFNCRSAYRGRNLAFNRNYDIGFRVVVVSFP